MSRGGVRIVPVRSDWPVPAPEEPRQPFRPRRLPYLAFRPRSVRPPGCATVALTRGVSLGATNNGRDILCCTAALLAASILAALPSIGHAQEGWPNRPVRIIVGFPPGGSLDVMTRLAAGQMAQRLGQPFVVETRTGASGNIGAEALARATPDGYTIGTVSMHNLLINPHLFKSLPYHPERDFAWISAM